MGRLYRGLFRNSTFIRGQMFMGCGLRPAALSEAAVPATAPPTPQPASAA